MFNEQFQICEDVKLQTGKARMLEQEFFPLLVQVTTLLLDKMRRIKNRMVRLKTRVETIRELLEKYLEDEGDMKNMNLTAKYVKIAAG